MDKSKIVVFLDPGHTEFTPGKCSPDKELREYAYAREIVSMIESRLDELGIAHWNTHPETGWVDSLHRNDSKDLILRANRIKAKYAQVKSQGKTAILLSVHVNAAGAGGWMSGRGWSAWTTKGQNNSDKLADCLYDAAYEVINANKDYVNSFKGQYIQKPIRTDMTDGDRDYESNFYIIKQSPCPAVLTENLFMDNKLDCAYLLGHTGKVAMTDIHVMGIQKWIERQK